MEKNFEVFLGVASVIVKSMWRSLIKFCLVRLRIQIVNKKQIAESNLFPDSRKSIN